VSAFSYTVSAVPYKKNAKKVNAGSKLKGASTMTVGINQKLPVNATAVPSKYGTAKGKKVIDTKIRLFVNSDTYIKHSGSNVIGKEVGSTDIYAISHNGNVKKVKVTTVDYAKPKAWINLSEAGIVENVIVDKGEALTSVASYFERYGDKGGWITLDDDGNLVSKNDIDISGIKDQILDLFSSTNLGVPRLYACKEGLAFDFVGSDLGGYHIEFSTQTDAPDDVYDRLNGDGIKIAPHWIAWCTVEV
jgi:hypothetical protein